VVVERKMVEADAATGPRGVVPLSDAVTKHGYAVRKEVAGELEEMRARRPGRAV
jgi:hypothetical protein